MKLRRLRIFFLSLFVAATVASALHTIEHHHGADHCPICTVAQHTTGADIITPLQEIRLCTVESDYPPAHEQRVLLPFQSIRSRAPPAAVFPL